jgi:hypothetical protein
MAIYSCGLPAHCCQPAVAGSFIYADLWGELRTHLALQVLFSQSSPVCEPLLPSFPFPSTLREVHCTHFFNPPCLFTVHMGSGSSPLSCGVFLLPLLLQAFLLLIAGRVLLLLLAGVFVYSSCGKWFFPPSPVEFSPSASLTAFPLLVAGHASLLLPSPASPSLFIYSFGRDSPPTPSALGAPHPLCYMSLLFLSLITQFLFFPWVGVGLSRGLC